MTGSGIFLLPAALAVYGGISIFGWLFTFVGIIFLTLVFSRLSRLISTAGGPYAYTREGFGDFPGFLVTWGYWISIWSGNAAISVAGIGYLSRFFPGLKENPLLSILLSIAVLWLFTFVNTRNIRSVGIVQFITTIIKIVPLLLLGTLGFLYFDPTNFSPLNLSGESNFDAVTATAALALWAFLGLESATVPSDKVRNPARTIPMATIVGASIAALLYISSTMAIMGIVAPADLQNSAAPFADAAQQAWGKGASAMVAICAAIACFGALNGWILLQGQFPLAAARDGLFPKVFKRESGKGIPVTGLIIGSVLASVLAAMNYSEGLVSMFSFIIKLSTLSCLLPYLFSSLAELSYCIRGKKEYCRRKIITLAFLTIPAFLYSLWAVTGLGMKTITWGIILLAAGIPMYLFVKYRKS